MCKALVATPGEARRMQRKASGSAPWPLWCGPRQGWPAGLATAVACLPQHLSSARFRANLVSLINALFIAWALPLRHMGSP